MLLNCDPGNGCVGKVCHDLPCPSRLLHHMRRYQKTFIVIAFLCRMLLVTALLLWSAIPNGAGTLQNDAHRATLVLKTPGIHNTAVRAYEVRSTCPACTSQPWTSYAQVMTQLPCVCVRASWAEVDACHAIMDAGVSKGRDTSSPDSMPTQKFVQHSSHLLQRMQAVLAALTMPGQERAPALGGRRALSGTLFEGAAEALGSQLWAGSQAAVSEAGKAAGKEVNHLLAALASPLANRLCSFG